MQPLSRWLRPVRPEAIAPPLAGDLPARVLGELARARERVARRVDALDALAEREILACGRVLATIVDEVRAITAEADQVLAASVARSDESTAHFIDDMQADLGAQEAAVADVLKLADGMQDAIDAITNLSQYSNLLAINSRIEAARIGELGAGFSVIAEHIRDLSKTISGAAGRVGGAIGDVRQALPAVRERADCMQQRARTFIGLVGEQVKKASSQSASGSATSRRLEAVMRLSNEALSHLQFHQSLAHELAAIDGDLEMLTSRVRRLLAGEVRLEAVPEDARAAADRPAPGTITLFEDEAR
jgi:methyl-accepting chemotaxis protein